MADAKPVKVPEMRKTNRLRNRAWKRLNKFSTADAEY
jgi:hypothetical protein